MIKNTTLISKWKQAFPGIIPERIGEGWLYFLVTTCTAFFCLSTVVYTSHIFLPTDTAVYIVASMGAAAVVMYAAPGSPMAKEWAFVVGNLSAAVVGVSCFKLIGDTWVTGPVAVASAIGVMHLLRCQHPPGGATALFAVIGGSGVHAMGYQYVLIPVALNVTVFLVFVLLHRKFLRWHAAQLVEQNALRGLLERSAWKPAISNKPPLSVDAGIIDDEDIEYALAISGTYLDIGREQLKELFQSALKRRALRNSFALRCADVMKNDKPVIAYGDTLLDAWVLMKKYHSDFLVVVDRGGFIEGILNLQTIMESVQKRQKGAGGINIAIPRNDRESKEFDRWMKSALIPSGSIMSSQPEVVGQLMEQAICFSGEAVIADILRDTLYEDAVLPVILVHRDNRFEGYVDLRDVSSR